MSNLKRYEGISGWFGTKAMQPKSSKLKRKAKRKAQRSARRKNRK